MSGELEHFIPIQKVDAEKREVWGYMAEEVPDKSNQIMDYASSKPNFLKWSEGISEVTGGKSLGNVREMHRNVAIGKLVHLEPDDDNLRFFVGAKILDDEAWQKIVEGVYTGFSVGGRYGKIWNDQTDPALKRYEAIPVEVSIVDNPAMYGTTFELVRGEVSEMRKFVGGLEKFDLEERSSQVRRAWHQEYSPKEGEENPVYSYTQAVLQDAIIIEREAALYSYPYSIVEDGEISFGEPVRVEVRYVPVTQNSTPEPEQETPGLAEPESDDGMAMGAAPGDIPDTSTEIQELQTRVNQALDDFEKLASNGAMESLSARIEELQKTFTDLSGRIEALETQPAGYLPALREVPSIPASGKHEVQELRRLAAVEPNPALRAEYARQLQAAEAEATSR